MVKIIDVVDEQDKVIGQEEKKICHEKHLWHRIANVMVFKNESYSEVLILKEIERGPNLPKLLAFPGGHLEKDETYLQGALRELHEEMLINLWLPNVDITPLFKTKIEASKEFVIVYRLAYSGPFRHNPQEVESYSFVNLREAIKDAESNPDKYTPKTVFLLGEYKRRFVR